MTIAEEKISAQAGEVPASALPAGGRHIEALDGLRGIAVLLVMCCHARILPLGGGGVDIFFVLSGYLITGILLNELQMRGARRISQFLHQAVAAAGAALFLLIALYLPAVYLAGLSLGHALGDSAIALFYISNWTRAFGNRPGLLGHTWSLSIEEQFYLVWPVMAVGLYRLLGRTGKAALVCAGLVAVCVVIYRHWMLATGASVNRVYNGLDTHGDMLLGGAALAFFMPVLPRVWASTAGWAGLAALAVYMMGRFGESFVYVMVCTLAILVGVVNLKKGLMARMLSNAVLVWVGRISYGLYLFHYPIMAYLTARKWSAAGIAAVGFPMAFALATASYYLVERPCLRLKDRFRPVAAAALNSGS